MTTSLIYVLISLSAVLIIAAVFRVEDARGGALVVLTAPRTYFDRCIRFCLDILTRLYQYLRHSFLRLFFHYAAQLLLKRLYALTHTLEVKTEELLRQSRRTTKRIDAEKGSRTYLDEIAEHKEETALTSEQIERMRSLD